MPCRFHAFSRFETDDVALICLCYVENATAAQIRYAIRRLRRKAPAALILVTLAGETSNTDRAEGLPAAADIAIVKGSLRAATEKILAVAANSKTKHPVPDLQPQMPGAVLSPV